MPFNLQLLILNGSVMLVIYSKHPMFSSDRHTNTKAVNDILIAKITC